MNENIIILFGMFLAENIHKSPIACKGLIRFAIIRYLKSHHLPEDKNISIEEFQEIVSNIIRADLANAKINDIEKIVQLMANETMVQKAIFSMSI